MTDTRKVFEHQYFVMTDAEFAELKGLSDEDQIDYFWETLGNKYHFVKETVERWDGMDQQHFKAVSSDF